MTGMTTDVPRLAAVTGDAIGRLFGTWLTRPHLRSATLVSFSTDPGVKFTDAERKGSIALFPFLERLASTVAVTLITAHPGAAQRPSTDRRLEQLGRLSAAGATVLLHPTLHAKVFLFQEDGRSCWIVGSSNLSFGGFGRNEELNLRGFHPDDYGQVAEAVRKLSYESVPI